MSKISELKLQIEELEKQTKELQKELEIEKTKNEIEYPFKDNETYFSIDIDGELLQGNWLNKCDYNQSCYDLGNVFQTRKEAEIEIERRNLLTRFRHFRDKCNGDWKPDWHSIMADKYHIGYDYESQKLDLYNEGFVTKCCVFGYFENEQDGYRAINLFGDEIKRLFVEE